MPASLLRGRAGRYMIMAFSYACARVEPAIAWPWHGMRSRACRRRRVAVVIIIVVEPIKKALRGRPTHRPTTCSEQIIYSNLSRLAAHNSVEKVLASTFLMALWSRVIIKQFSTSFSQNMTHAHFLVAA